ncbi:acetylserotonin O-methyltransferase [Amycolatopsis aidingensis]|uniref:acetylserotonin O-methyltransferase n=1 Tax=Amycolatopsis aidingensis TaxID=2842453 RepID=UPI001E407CC3|nr:acetylserotonin O-methyltransferase [Amycolatopsis aidingensis]
MGATTEKAAGNERTDDSGTAELMRLAQGYWAAKTFLSAAELELFTVLAEQPATEPELRDRLGLHPRATQDFLDALVGLGVLDKDGDRYRNSAAAQTYLDKNSPRYIGGFCKLLNFHFQMWGGLTDLLRTGESQMRGGYDFDKLYEAPERVRAFLEAMDGASSAVGPALAEAFDWSSYKSFVDVGGARGNAAAGIARAHPHLHGGCYDLAPVEPFFDEHMARLGLSEQVTFYPGDFFTDPLPETDVVIFGHVLHDWDDERRMTLLRKAFDALPAGGCVLVYDALVDHAASYPTSLLTSLNMRLLTPGGSEYTAERAYSWLTAAGFTDLTTSPLVGPDKLICGHKRSG